jgi:hypothetical protein
LEQNTKTGGRAVVLPLVHACSFVFHCHRQPHHAGNEAFCVWKNAAVEQLSMRSLPFKTKHFISAVKKKNPAVPTSCALAIKETPVNI